MPIFISTDGFFSANGVDLSDHVKSINLNASSELQDSTAMGATYRSRKGGLKDWSVTVEFYADEASSSVNQTLWGLLGTSTTVIAREVNTGGVSDTNPNYTGSAILEDMPVITASLGEIATLSGTFQGDGALSRAET